MIATMNLWREAEFDGNTYDPMRDRDRLTTALDRVYMAMRDQDWHTLAELSEVARCSEAAASARIRDLRKPKFGGFVVQRKYVEDGRWAYRLVLPAGR